MKLGEIETWATVYFDPDLDSDHLTMSGELA
jgi:hypothetical protein